MAKDPAVLFYTSDFLSGTFTMDYEQKGKYITLLCIQHQKGFLTEKDLRAVLQDTDVDVFDKFNLSDDGLYYNVKMKECAEKRKAYSQSRSNNRKAKSNNISETNDIDIINLSKSYVNHMENENENETVNDNKAKDEVETSSCSTISYTVAKKLLAELCDWSLSFSMFEEALEEMNSIGFNKLCVLAQLSESEIDKIKECVSIRVEQQN